MTFTLGTAAKACGINKTTVLKAIKTGRLSGTRNDEGNWSIEPVELFRVFPPVAAVFLLLIDYRADAGSA